MKYASLNDLGRKQSPAEVTVHLDDRVAPRFTLLIRAAKLVCDAGEFLCVVRDVSATGLSARLFHELPEDGAMMLEMQTGDSFEIDLVWQDRGMAGFQFRETVEIEALIHNSTRFPKRELRFSAHAPVNLCAAGRTLPAELHNLSQQGAMIKCSEELAIDQLLKIDSAFTPDVEARVRWRKDGYYGLILDTTFGMTALAQLIERFRVAGTAHDQAKLAETRSELRSAR